MNKKKTLRFKELSVNDLRWNCDCGQFEFESTQQLEPIEGIIGQERALKALKLGVDLRSPGYNIYIAGLSGSGKITTVKQILEKLSSNCPAIKDYAYVNNFSNRDMPILLTFPPGKAKLFKQDLSQTINLLRKQIPLTLESDSYIQRKKNLIQKYNQKEQELMKSFQDKIKKDNFALGQVKIGEVVRPDILPVIDQKAISIHQLEELIGEGKISKKEAGEFYNKYSAYQEELQKIFRKGLAISQEFQVKLNELETEAASAIIEGVLDNLKEKYSDSKIINYLDCVEKSILENIQIFKSDKTEEETPEGFTIDYFKEYDVNIILDNSDVKECPVIIETSPNYIQLFGTFEKINDGRGGWYTDFTKIKAGSILRANGGYLVMNVLHMLEEPGVWKTLKRVLTYRQLEIQDALSLFHVSPSIMKPEPIEIDTKVILVGSQFIYSLLAETEYDFKKIFKVKADFDYEVNRNEKILVEYARVVKKIIKEENLQEFDKSAIGSLIEIAAKFAGRKDKLTTRFSQIADIAREANFWAIDDGFDVVSSEHILKAYNLAKERHSLPEAKISEMIENNSILIDTEGERIGQINGLAVYSADFYSFGKPSRITATVSLGNGSIINVEREAGMAGKTYNKGVLIITGYFRETFGQNVPLSFNANLVFEQSYGLIDGDSASCAEIFCLLSTLSSLPLKQSIAVTGSLNQKGDVQPIGGVNEKIEGFFDLCNTRGLTKKQGVIIPVQNVDDLMLKAEVVDAVRKKEFHIYPISRIEQGIEILTGLPAGVKTKSGKYPPNTVFYLVEKKIKELFEKSKAAKKSHSPSTKSRKKK